jgi:hypothetical protein
VAQGRAPGRRARQLGLAGEVVARERARRRRSRAGAA